jgi:hypothetical protein
MGDCLATRAPFAATPAPVDADDQKPAIRMKQAGEDQPRRRPAGAAGSRDSVRDTPPLPFVAWRVKWLGRRAAKRRIEDEAGREIAACCFFRNSSPSKLLMTVGRVGEETTTASRLGGTHHPPPLGLCSVVAARTRLAPLQKTPLIGNGVE